MVSLGVFSEKEGQRSFICVSWSEERGFAHSNCDIKYRMGRNGGAGNITNSMKRGENYG